jgi:hypothetical protein
MKRSSTIALGLCLIFNMLPSAFAGAGGGSEVGNGGEVITLPDDTVILGDPYTSRPDPSQAITYDQLNASLKAEIERAGRFLVKFGAAVDNSIPNDPTPTDDQIQQMVRKRYLSRVAQAAFLVSTVMDTAMVQYYFVDPLPSTCTSAEDIDANGLPNGYQLDLGGCTEGPVTWIDKTLFAKMNVREQAKLLIHERMHALMAQYGFPHYMIADITDGLDVAMTLYNDQINSQRPVLTSDQVTKLETLIAQILRTHLADGRPETESELETAWTVSPNGGALVSNTATVSPQAYVGVGSLIGSGSTISPGALILNSSCYRGGCQLQNGAQMLESTIMQKAPSTETDPAPEDFASDFHRISFSATIGNGSILNNSTVTIGTSPSASTAPSVVLADGSNLSNSSVDGALTLTLDAGASLASDSISLSSDGAIGATLELGANSSLQNLQALLIVQKTANTSLDKIVLPASRALDFALQPICQPSLLLLLRNDLSINDSTSSLQQLCQPFSEPKP